MLTMGSTNTQLLGDNWRLMTSPCHVEYAKPIILQTTQDLLSQKTRDKTIAYNHQIVSNQGNHMHKHNAYGIQHLLHYDSGFLKYAQPFQKSLADLLITANMHHTPKQTSSVNTRSESNSMHINRVQKQRLKIDSIPKTVWSERTIKL